MARSKISPPEPDNYEIVTRTFNTRITAQYWACHRIREVMIAAAEQYMAGSVSIQNSDRGLSFGELIE